MCVSDWLEGLDTWIHSTTGLRPQTQDHLIQTAITILALWLARQLILRLVSRRGERQATAAEDFSRIYYQWRQGTAYVGYGLAFLLVGRIWVESFESLATVFGLISAGLAVALKDPLLNFAGWLFIVWRKPFELGDRIEVGEFHGDVVGQGMFTFSLMEIGNWVDADDRTGRLLIAPNGVVFTDVVANYSKGWFEQVWNELRVTVSFESNWQAARELLETIASEHDDAAKQASLARSRRHSHEVMVLPANVEPRVFVTVEDIGVGLTMRYVCRPWQRRSTSEAIWIKVLEAFGEREDIDFAYPTLRYFDNAREGKQGLRAPATKASR